MLGRGGGGGALSGGCSTTGNGFKYLFLLRSGILDFSWLNLCTYM